MSANVNQACIEKVLDPRSATRHRLGLPVGLSAANAGSNIAVIRNLSETGLLLETLAPLSIDELIEVNLPDAEPRVAKVEWVGDQFFGCRFVESLPRAIVSAAILRSPIEEVRLLNKTVASERTVPDVSEGQSSPGHLTLRARAWIIASLALESWAAIGLLIGLAVA
jgi:hypothetical protein